MSEMSTARKRMLDSTSIWFYAAAIFYIIQAIIALFTDFSPSLYDFSASILLLGLLYFLHLVYGFSKTVPICTGIGLIFNILGLYRIIPYNQYYIGTLYGAPQLGFHYDWIAHSIGFGFFALAFASMTYPYLIKAFSNKYAVFIIILLAMMGFGALNEINEFIGFNLLGVGSGFLEFGVGDTSPFDGPWQNSSMDMINNMIGGIVFLGGFFLYKNYSIIRKSKKGRPQSFL